MLSFSRLGKGQALILIHGFFESKEIWKEFAAALSENHTVYGLDLPGFGGSSLLQNSISIEEVALQVDAWITQQNILDPVVIGHSLGGYVALALAEIRGARLKALGLFHSTALPDDEEKRHTRNKTITFFEKNGIDSYLDSFVPGLVAPQSVERLSSEIDFLVNEGKRSSAKAGIAYTAAMRDRKDRIEVWRNFPGKKLMIAGVLDPAVKIDNSRLHRESTDVYVELESVGHLGMIEAPDNCLSAIKTFLQAV